MESMVSVPNTEKPADGLLNSANPTEQSGNQTNNYGIELEEVDFAAFDRRKTPRLDTQKAFTEFVESLKSDDILPTIA